MRVLVGDTTTVLRSHRQRSKLFPRPLLLHVYVGNYAYTNRFRTILNRNDKKIRFELTIIGGFFETLYVVRDVGTQ